MGTAREKIAIKLRDELDLANGDFFMDLWLKIADFVIEDRKRLVEPLVKLDLKPGAAIEVSISNMGNVLEAVRKTLKSAGLE